MNKEEKAELEELYENSEWWHNRFNAVQRDYENLQQRIDKAIEYIKHNQNNREGLSITEYHKKWLELYDYYESESIMKDLLEILGDKENE